MTDEKEVMCRCMSELRLHLKSGIFKNCNEIAIVLKTQLYIKIHSFGCHSKAATYKNVYKSSPKFPIVSKP